jgi:hypothetical protein
VMVGNGSNVWSAIAYTYIKMSENQAVFCAVFQMLKGVYAGRETCLSRHGRFRGCG